MWCGVVLGGAAAGGWLCLPVGHMHRAVPGVVSTCWMLVLCVLYVCLCVQDNDATLTLKEMKDSVAAIFKVCDTLTACVWGLRVLVCWGVECWCW